MLYFVKKLDRIFCHKNTLLTNSFHIVQKWLWSKEKIRQVVNNTSCISLCTISLLKIWKYIQWSFWNNLPLNRKKPAGLHVGSKTHWSVLCWPKKVTGTNVAVAKSIHHKVLLLPFWISAKNSPTLWHFGEEGHLSNYAKKGSNPKRGIRSIKSWKTS